MKRRVLSLFLAILLSFSFSTAVTAVEDLGVHLFPPTIISAGNSGNLAIKSDNSLWTCDTKIYRQLEDETLFDSLESTQIMDDVISTDIGDDFSIALKTDGSLWAWGNLRNFGLEEEGPIKIMDEVVFAVAGTDDIAFIKPDGSLWLWGVSVRIYSFLSQQGLIEEDIREMEPLKIMEDVAAASVSESIYSGSVLAIKTDGTLWQWDAYHDDDSGKTMLIASNIYGLSDVASVSYTGRSAMVVKTDGSLWGWGLNFGGELGTGTTESVWAPEQIMEDVASVSMGFNHTLAVKTDGSVWAWGSNEYGQLGNGKLTTHLENHDSYVPIKVMEDAVSVAVGYEHSLAVKKDGSLWSWGDEFGSKWTVMHGSEIVASGGIDETFSTPVKIMDGVKLPMVSASVTVANAPSTWAAAEVTAAIEIGLVPENLQQNYTSVVSRGDVAQMFVNLVEQTTGQNVDEYLAAKGTTINSTAFSDTTDHAVLAANALGLIRGLENGRFDPDGTITRAQIAAIITRYAILFGENVSGYSHGFTDVAGHWVDAELGWPVHAGIINGVGERKFDPDGQLTTEQAIAITYRALQKMMS